MKIDYYEQLLIDISYELTGFLINKKIQKQDAEDIVQDVFVKLIQTDLVLPPNKLRPWLYRVALSKFYDLYRRQKRYRDILLAQYTQYSDIAPDMIKHTVLQQALDELDDYQKSLVLLYYDDRKRIREIATIYDVSESKIKVDLYRTRQQLKHRMEREQT
ncbi:RNA polymerase sigma factor [Leuconostoc miyukkimchii]|uniref:RNA polymerase sigma factor n=1 Tax=Leuconostoc miyukkimchii TaxID=910540 RepID=UPI001C7DF94B|nr:RNA polymerase sigma factor [Leuconostoc miyukkimchii]